MKKFLFICLALLFSTLANAKNLIVYYTLTNNTEKAAKVVQKSVGGDLYKIETVEPYPTEYKVQIEIAKKELKDGILRKIKQPSVDLKEYDVIFIGSPVWWGSMSIPVRTFLATTDLKGKTVIPFVTHGGGGADNSFDDTKKLCKDCNVLDGWSGYGSVTLGLSKWAKDSLKKIKK